MKEGVHDPRQGDFAVAGSIDFNLGIEGEERGVRLESSCGSFNTFKELVDAGHTVPECSRWVRSRRAGDWKTARALARMTGLVE